MMAYYDSVRRSTLAYLDALSESDLETCPQPERRARIYGRQDARPRGRGRGAAHRAGGVHSRDATRPGSVAAGMGRPAASFPVTAAGKIGPMIQESSIVR